MQSTKPAAEPILLAQKPYQGKPVDSITRTGAGSLWIDGGRISTTPDDQNFRGNRGLGRSAGGFYGEGKSYRKREEDKITEYQQHAGRWPGNFVLQHLPGCVRIGERQVKTAWSQPKAGSHEDHQVYGDYADNRIGNAVGYTDATGHETVAAYQCAPGCVVASLDQQAGEREARGGQAKVRSGEHGSCYSPCAGGQEKVVRNDTGGASRFFMTADWSLDIAERLAQADPVFYCAKASRRERDSGLEGMPLQRRYTLTGDTRPSRADGQERNNHTPGQPCRNPHPTVKPLKLTQWLATLLLPPAAYAPRRILCPFSGTGSEGLGALLAGWEEIVMIEQDPSYCEISRARIKYWSGNHFAD